MDAEKASSSSERLLSFVPGEGDIGPITGVKDFLRELRVESKKLWVLAGPAIFTFVFRYSLGAVTQVFLGQVGTLALAAFAIENSVIAGLSLGVLMGMGSALETLCGQAFGAGQIEMLGVYLQRSWIILSATALLLLPLYIFSTPLLKLIGQTAEISDAAGTFALYMIPQLFAYALNFPISRYLQAQRKIFEIAAIAGVALVLHTVFSWVLIVKVGWGMAGAAVVLNASWVFIVAAQMVYVFCGGCGLAWSGFSMKAFRDLWAFVRLSFASAIMICLETWYFMALILFAGYLKNAQVSVDALSICMNIVGWTVMIAMGSNAAVSVRVSNELGAAHPRTAKIAVAAAVVSSTVINLVLFVILMATKNEYPSLFTSSSDVRKIVSKLTPLLATCVFINGIQPVLSGVAVGAGWQALVAYVNVGCYYLFGVPLGLLLGYKLDMGVEGIWLGMMTGTVAQTCILFGLVYRTNWNKEASMANERIKKWGGEAR
uniref:Protein DETOXIFICATION n=1 Tax=Kalanchoe fedtschenkoi TaxID=63787 RepID=A0A7N0TEP2_KALFE